MANYVIGDLQGCFSEFIALLEAVDFHPSRDHLYLVGDIVARGPDSLACLKYLYQLQDSVTITLGNHDLHLLATYYSNKLPNPKDNLSALFSSKKLSSYIHFLQHQPLAKYLPQHNTLICHAGLNPQLSLKKGLSLAEKAQKYYQGQDAQYYLKNMYGNSANSLSQTEDKLTRFRFTVNAFTRMRFVNPAGEMEFEHKNSPSQTTNKLKPWFDVNSDNHKKFNICFGHWAALQGVTPYPNLFALDTGCVWGNHMTLLELGSNSVYQQEKINT